MVISFFFFQWEFYSMDKNHNDILDEEEIETMIDRNENCMVGFMKSCDYDHKPGISRKEWNACFPPLAAGEWATVPRKKAREKAREKSRDLGGLEHFLLFGQPGRLLFE